MDWVFIERLAWPAANLAVGAWAAVWVGRRVLERAERFFASLENALQSTQDRHRAEVVVLGRIEESLRRQLAEVQASCTRTELVCQGQSRLGATQVALPRRQELPQEPGS
jgi:hypothetical protein